MAPVSKADAVLDFRHEDGTNWYLVKSRRSGEISWVTENNLPKGFDDQLVRIRKKKGEFARNRVFGEKGQSGRVRKVQFADAPKLDAEAADSASSSDYSSSESSGDETLKKSTGVAADGGLSKATSGMNKPTQQQSQAVANLVSVAGCRSLVQMPHVLNSEGDVKLNQLFVGLLYSKPETSWHREVLDLIWTLTITLPASEERDRSLEVLCTIASRLGSHDSVVSNSIDELLSEASSERSEINSDNFKVFTRLCDLVTESRIQGVLPEAVTTSASDEEMEEAKNSAVHVHATRERFSYLPPGQVELDDAGIVELVYKLYRLKNPEKLLDVPGIIEKYKSQLSVLFATLLKKYQVEIADLGDSRVFLPIDQKGNKLKDRLVDLFSVYEPSRLVDVNEIVGHYLGRPVGETADYLEALERSYLSVYSKGALVRDATDSDDSGGEAFGFRTLIQEALAVGNPEKLSDVNALLHKYKGKEHFVYLAVCDKYSVPVDEKKFRAADALREAHAEAERKARMHQVLSGVYEQYNPAKLPEVPKLIEKYPVLQLFDLMVKKYHISLAEKVELLLSTKVLSEGEIDFTASIKETVQALALALAVEQRAGLIQGGVHPAVLKNLYSPVAGATVAEITVQGKSALYAAMGAAGSTAGGSQIEAALRDLVEGKLMAVLRKLPVEPIISAQVTAQEPEYLAADSFAAAETGRVSCVVALKCSDPDRLALAIHSVLSHLALVDSPALKSADDQSAADDSSGITVGPGAFRAHTVLRTSGQQVRFVGDFRAMVDKGTENSPSVYRSRLACWASVGQESIEQLMEVCVQWPRWLRKCAVLLDVEAGTVALAGSHKHGAAFRLGLQAVRLGEPNFKLHIPKHMCQRPGLVLAPHIYEWSDVTYHDSADDLDSTFEGPATETVRPLRLTRTTMRDSYLQGQLCLNCDETTHKPPECPIKRKVCWNCHGAHAGAACVLPCRFCKGRHGWGILECVKRGAKRFADWVKSRSFAEEKGLGSMIDDLIGKLRENGWNTADPAVIAANRTLNQMGVYADLFVEMAKEQDWMAERDSAGGTSRAVKPIIPAVAGPALPDSKYEWTERVWLDEILSPALMGRDAMRVIAQTKGSALKQLESKENCKIVFRGASAKEIFGQSNSESPEIDLRFHAVIMCDSPQAGLVVKRAFREMVTEVERGIAEGTIQRPPVVEAFSFLEKVAALNDNIAQFDFLNVNGGAPIELDLKNHFEHIGDLRHWLHQRGVEVELGDDNAVKLPSTSRVIEATDKLSKPIIDAGFVEVFNAFFELSSFWVNAPPSAGGPYWFEPYELRPVGLLGLAEKSAEGLDQCVFESGQVVCLSEQGAHHFGLLLAQGGFLPDGSDAAAIKEVLMNIRGVVRTVARDNRLLMYLKHPWALGSATGTVARDVPENFSDVFGSVLNYRVLRDCGRLGHTERGFEMVDPDPELIRKMLNDFEADGDVASLVPGDHLIQRLSLESVPEGELPYVGYIVDWVTPPEVTDFVSGMGVLGVLMQDESLLSEPEADPLDILAQAEALMVPELYVPEPVVAPVAEDLNALSVADLKEKLKEKGLATTGRKVDLIERIQAEQRVHAQIAKPVFKCRVDLPRALMNWPELANNLSGPGNSHFGHIKQQCPTANLVCIGSASAALVGEARLHVQITAADPEDFKKAKSLTEDLVKAVVEVGADICMADEDSAARAAALKEVRIVVLSEQK